MKLIILPGWPESVRDPEYFTIGDAAIQMGIEPIFIDINWWKRSRYFWHAQVIQAMNESEGEEFIIFGFSIGAMIAFKVASEDHRVKHAVIASMSSYFSEDIANLPWYRKLYAGWLFWFDWFKQYECLPAVDEFNSVSPLNRTSITLLTGEQEDPSKSVKVHRQIEGSKYVMVNGVGHNMGDPKYYSRVIEELKLLPLTSISI